MIPAPAREAAPPAVPPVDGIRDVAAVTLAKARDHLLSLQDPRGWWIGELETNVTMDAEDVLLRHFLGILTEVELAETAGWIRSQQRDDGTWANFYLPMASKMTNAPISIRRAPRSAKLYMREPGPMLPQ